MRLHLFLTIDYCLLLFLDCSEHLVQQAIDDMLSRGKNDKAGNMTVLIVAHRLSTVRNADKIFVVQGGKVVEGKSLSFTGLANH